MKKLFITIGLIVTTFTFFIVKANATTENWIETETIDIEIEIDFSEMSAKQAYNFFNFLYDNGFAFDNGEYEVDWINNFEIIKYVYYEPQMPGIMTEIIISFNNEGITILHYLDVEYDIFSSYNKWLILNGSIEVPKGIYNNIWVNGHIEGYFEGYEFGHSNGVTYGYDWGYDDGLTDGYDLGYDKGILDGENEGFIDGYNKGRERGKEEGFIDGFNEGREEEKIISRNIYAKYYNGVWLTAEEYANIRVQQTINEIGNADDNKIGLIGFIPAILGSIGAFFFTLASFEVMGISLMSIITLFASLAVIILIIKLIKGGD